MTAWLLLDGLEILFYTGKEHVPLDRQVRTITQRQSISVELTAQVASITPGRRKKLSLLCRGERRPGVTQGGAIPG